MSRRRLPVSTRRAIRCVARLVGSLHGAPNDVSNTTEAESEPALAQVASLDAGTPLDGALRCVPLGTVPGAWVGGAP